MNDGEVQLAQNQFMRELLREQLMDLMIGSLRQAERMFMLRTFGESHAINNVYGTPTTWIRRLTRE